MTKGKMHVYIEIAYDILGTVFSTLCRNKEIEKAEELQEIMRQLIVFSDRLLKKQKSAVVPNAKTVAALNAIGRATHSREEIL